MKTKAYFYNSFHGTHAYMYVEDGKPISKTQLNRLFKSLCGMDDCNCAMTWSSDGYIEWQDAETAVWRAINRRQNSQK